MKWQGDMSGGLIHEPHLRRVRHKIAAFLRACPSAIRNAVRGFVTNLQIGRMESTLRALSEEDLKHIGITRAEIPRHARFLVTYEYDGL